MANVNNYILSEIIDILEMDLRDVKFYMMMMSTALLWILKNCHCNMQNKDFINARHKR